MPVFVLSHRAGPVWDHELPFHEQPGVLTHVEFMRRIDAQGVMRAGGPFPDGGTDPVGMVIVEVADLAEAEHLAASDASITHGLLEVSVRPWTPRMGTWLEG